MIDDVSNGPRLYAERRGPTTVVVPRGQSRLGLAWLVGCLCLAAWTALGGPILPKRAAGPKGVAATATTVASAPERWVRTKKIEDFQVGERIAGRNPLREQADLFEPNEADWLKISFRKRQQNGRWLWIDLLRPKEWVRANGVGPGCTIHLDLPEMGAVGDARVVDIGPCPAIEDGDGTVVTGTFKRESDGKHVVELRLEGQEEPTGVTDNHPYWSVDRREFIEVGKLRMGELVDTEFGPRHVESVKPCFYRGYLYNLETTEHVFRVGSLGTLVHNSCPSVVNDVLNEAASAVGNITSAHFLNYDEALQAGMRWLGSGYREIGRAGSGVFVSADGLRRFRIDASSLLGKHRPHVPHVHFEWLENGIPVANNHVPIGP